MYLYKIRTILYHRVRMARIYFYYYSFQAYGSVPGDLATMEAGLHKNSGQCHPYAMVELLKSGRINNRLLCEIATHENFTALMTDAEIYVDGIATMRFQDINASLEAVRAEILKKYQPEEEDTTLKALQASQIQEEDYFCHVTHKEWDAILHDIRLAHEADAESAPDDSSTLKIIADVEKSMHFPGNALDKFCYVMCSQLQISYEKLTKKERTDLKNIMKKSCIYKDSPLGSRKR